MILFIIIPIIPQASKGVRAIAIDQNNLHQMEIFVGIEMDTVALHITAL